MKNKKHKKTIKHVFFGLLIGGLTLIGIWQLLSFQVKIQQQQEREKVALWVVQHFSGKEPIKSIKVGRINTHGILGSAGKSTSLIINDKKVNRLEGVDLDDNGIPNGSYFYDDDFEYTYHEKKISHVTLKGVKVGIWKDN